MVARLGTHGGLSVFGGVPDDIATAWDCIEDCTGKFFSDYDAVSDADSWAVFVRNRVYDFAVARDESRAIVCGAYIIVESGDSVCFHAFAHRDYRSPTVTVPCALAAIRYFFEAHPIRRMSTLGRWKNRVARMTAARLGFTIEGRPREFLPYCGIFEDCYYGSILKGEVM